MQKVKITTILKCQVSPYQLFTQVVYLALCMVSYCIQLLQHAMFCIIPTMAQW